MSRERDEECHRAGMVAILHLVVREWRSPWCVIVDQTRGRRGKTQAAIWGLSRRDWLCRGWNQEVAGAECPRGGEKGKSYRISQVNIRTLNLTLSDGEARGGFCRAEERCYVTCIFKGITVAAVLNIDSREPGEETEGPERKQLQSYKWRMMVAQTIRVVVEWRGNINLWMYFEWWVRTVKYQRAGRSNWRSCELNRHALNLQEIPFRLCLRPSSGDQKHMGALG